MSGEDLASLGIKVDSTDTVSAAGNLDKLTVSGKAAEAQMNANTVSASQFAAALKLAGGDLRQVPQYLDQVTASASATAAAQAQVAAATKVSMSSVANDIGVASGLIKGAFYDATASAAIFEAAMGESAVVSSSVANAIGVSSGLIKTSFYDAAASAAFFDSALASNEAMVLGLYKALTGLSDAQLGVAATATEEASAVVAANTSMAASMGALGTASVRAAAEVVASEESMAVAATESAAVQVAAHTAVTGSSLKVRESLVLMREAARGDFTRLAGSATILAQAFGVLIPVLIAGAAILGTLAGIVALAENQINQSSGDLTANMNLTADQLDRVKDRYVTFGDTIKGIWDEVKSELAGIGIGDAVQSVWNGIASFIYQTLIGVTGAVQGAVNVIAEEWKRMPTILGGQGASGDQVNAAGAFGKGFDDNKKQLDDMFARIAADARKEAQDRIKKEAGKAPRGSNDNTLDRAAGTLKEVQDQTAAQNGYNDALEKGSMTLAEVAKQEAIDNDVKSLQIRYNADLASSDAKRQAEAVKLLPILQQLRVAYGAQYDANIIKAQDAANDNAKQQNDLLEQQINLAGQDAQAQALAIAQYKTLQDLKKKSIDPNSATGQAAQGLAGDNARRQGGVQRASLANNLTNSFTALGTSAAQTQMQNRLNNYVKMTQEAYKEIDALRQQDLISEQEAIQAKALVDVEVNQQRLKWADDFFGNLATLSESKNKELAAIGKAAAMTQAGIDGVLAVQKALATYPPPINYIMAAAVGVAAAENVAKIAGFQSGGYTGDGATDQAAGVVHGKEFVVNAAGTANHRPLLEAINSGSPMPQAATNTNVGGAVRVVIEDHGTPKTYTQVPGTTRDEARLIAQDVMAEQMPKAMAQEAAKKNSPFRRTMAQHTSIQSKMTA